MALLRSVISLCLLSVTFVPAQSLVCYYGNELNVTKDFPNGMGTCQAENSCIEFRDDIPFLHFRAGCDGSCERYRRDHCRECHTDRCNSQFTKYIVETGSDYFCYESAVFGSVETRCRRDESCGWKLFPNPKKNNTNSTEMLAFQGCSGICMETFGGNCTLCDTDRCNDIVVPEGVNVTFQPYSGEWYLKGSQVLVFQRYADEAADQENNDANNGPIESAALTLATFLTVFFCMEHRAL